MTTRQGFSSLHPILEYARMGIFRMGLLRVITLNCPVNPPHILRMAGLKKARRGQAHENVRLALFREDMALLNKADLFV